MRPLVYIRPKAPQSYTGRGVGVASHIRIGTGAISPDSIHQLCVEVFDGGIMP